MQDIITWIQTNCEWLFDGAGTEIIIMVGTGATGIVGWLIRRILKKHKNESENKVVDNSTFCESISGNKNIMGNNNTINIYQSQHDKKEKSLFSTRFAILQKLLNDARYYDEKEYTIEYISSLVGIKNVGEMKEYVEGKKEPDEEIKQRFVDVFCVNRDWMLFNQGDYPFASNLKRYKNGATVFDNYPMDILRNERLSEIQKFIIVIGRYDHRRSVLIIQKSSECCYELYPKVYDLDPNVGGTGRRKLVSFYRFLREANRIGKIYGLVYEVTEEQFRDLFMGAVTPMIVRNYKVFNSFTENFLDLSDAQFERDEKFLDKDLVEVKKIIRCDIENTDIINQKSDLKLIQQNLEENSYREKNVKMTKNRKKKVFISYSWVPEENKQWVKKLAERLETDGIEVVIDYKDLKLGHDKYAFMERMVSDPSIDKVLIICNSGYKKKADKREGGVGDESIIITPQVYGKAEQEKFIPVVNERDAHGEPYLPIYLASRMYADLTNFSEGYKILIENITGNVMTTLQPQINSETAFVEKKEVKSNEKCIDEYVNVCTEIIKQPRIIFSKSFVDKLIERQIALYKLNNQGLNKLAGKFCKEIQNRLNVFDEESAKSLWNISDRMHEYMEEGLIGDGEIIDQVEFEAQEHINNEINAYQKENIVNDNMVRKHISDIYACIHGELASISELSDKYVKAKELDKKVVLNLEKQKTNVSESNGVQDLRLFFKNVTDNQVTSVDIIPSEDLVKEMEGTVWERNQESKMGVIITQYDAMTGDINVNENGEFQYMLRYKTYNNHFLLICFCVKTKSIYGIETKQLFNIVITGGIINQVFIETEY